jgi:hypothetical protein
MPLALCAPHEAAARKHFSTASIATRFLRGTRPFSSQHAIEYFSATVFDRCNSACS